MAKKATAASPAVRGSKTGRPVMALLDLLGRRWSLRIVWELREDALTSRALRAACDDASPTVMQQRLSELREAGFIEQARRGRLRTDAARQGAAADVTAAVSVRRSLAGRRRRAGQ